MADIVCLSSGDEMEIEDIVEVIEEVSWVWYYGRLGVKKSVIEIPLLKWGIYLYSFSLLKNLKKTIIWSQTPLFCKALFLLKI